MLIVCLLGSSIVSAVDRRLHGSTAAGLARRDYKDAVAAFLERWHSRAGAEGFQYSLIVTDTPPDRALRNFLLARTR